MDIKPNGRLGLIPATALFVCFAAPSQAAMGAEAAAGTARSESVEAFVAIQKQAKHRSRHWKKNAHLRSDKVALNSTADYQANGAKVGDGSRTIPPSVANANAELQSADSAITIAARAMSARASSILKAGAADRPSGVQLAEANVVSADQLNDVDRALQESSAPAATVARAASPVPSRISKPTKRSDAFCWRAAKRRSPPVPTSRKCSQSHSSTCSPAISLPSAVTASPTAASRRSRPSAVTR